jgi:radical SAM protein with 4Fe4S-binding SPASM domain
MKARIAPPQSAEREVLAEVLPLDTPFCVCIDVSSACNIACKYCVQYETKINSASALKKQVMDYDLYVKIIDDCKSFNNRIKVLYLYGWGEPLINPKFVDMVRYAKAANVANSIATITNGLLLTPEMSNKIINSGLTNLNISIQSMTEQGYYDICGKKMNYAEFVGNIKYLYAHKSDNLSIYIKIADVGLQDKAEQQLFYDTYGDICDKIFVEHIITVRNDAEIYKEENCNSGKGVFGQKLRKTKVCPFLFYRLMICSDGIVVPCNADWYREFVLGDVAQTPLKKIWNSVKLHELWKTHLTQGLAAVPLCSKCGNVKYYATDNVDDHADIIFNRLKNKELKQ